MLERITRRLPAALLFVSLAVWPSAAPAQPAVTFDAFFTFGDSLADTGNVWLTSRLLHINPAPPPSISPHRTYFEGRFSNGPVAFEYLWQRLSGAAPGSSRALRPYIAWPFIGPKSAANFAFGGTGTPLLDQTPGGLFAPGLKGQVELFGLAMRGKKPSPRALFAIVTGANDYTLDGNGAPLSPPVVVRNIGQSVARLYALGARTIMVLGLPDLGRLPGADPAASELTLVHNTLLEATIAQLSAQLPGARLIFVDINVVFDLLPPDIEVNVPALAAYGAQLPVPQPELAACLLVNPATCQNVPFAVGTPFLFWDIVHPTTGAHQAIADYLFTRLSQ